MVSQNHYGNIFFLRHGETVSNSKRYWSNYFYEGLNENGIRQAEEIGKRIEKLKFDAIYTSPHKRCIQTISYSIGPENAMRAIQVVDLKEREMDGVQNMTSNDIMNKFGTNVGTILSEDFDRIPEIEKSDLFIARVSIALKQIFQESTGKNILIVSHGGTMSVFLKDFINIDPLPRTFLNCAFLGIEYDGEKFHPRVSLNMKSDWYASINPSWKGLPL